MSDLIQEASPSPSTPALPTPLFLRLAAAFSILFGASSIVSMIVPLLRGGLWIDIGIVGIPIGGGLLIGRTSSRTWAIFLSGIGLALTALSITAIAIKGPSQNITREEFWSGVVSVALSVLGFSTVFFGLRSSRVVEWFKTNPNARVESPEWKLPLVVVGLLFAVTSATSEFAMDSVIRKVFAVQIQFEFRDAKTGEGIKSIGSSGMMSSSNRRRDPFEPHLSFSTFMKNDGLTYEVNGYAFRPHQITSTATGYLPITYTLTEESPRVKRLEFQPE